MLALKLIGICFLASCGSRSVAPIINFQKVFPDTSKSWAGRMTREDVYETRSLENKFHLLTLTNGTKNTEMRIWEFSAAYDPQTLNILQHINSKWWTLRTITFYRAKKDSIVADNNRNIQTDLFDSITLSRYWNMPSQSDLREGDKYGCMDGSDMVIELANAKTYKLKWYCCPGIHKTKDSAFLLASELANRLSLIIR